MASDASSRALVASSSSSLEKKKKQSVLFLHFRVIYFLVSLLYIGLSINFVIVYQVAQKCQNPLNTPSPSSSSSNVKDTSSTTEHLARQKRHLKHEQLFDSLRFNVSLNEDLARESSPAAADEYSESNTHRKRKRHHHRHTRHHDEHSRTKQEEENHASKRVSREDNVASVEFFPDPQPTQETKGHVWLNSYSRIPLPVLMEYCFSAKQYCPAGIPGEPGSKGEPGEPGPRGNIILLLSNIFIANMLFL